MIILLPFQECVHIMKELKSKNECIYNFITNVCDVSLCEKNKCIYCETIFDVTGVMGVLFTALEKLIVNVSESFSKNTGFEREKIVQRSISDSCFQLGSEDKKNLDILLSSSESFRYPVWIKDKNCQSLFFTGLFNTIWLDKKQYILCLLIPSKGNPEKYNLQRNKNYIDKIEHLEKVILRLNSKIEFLKEENERIYQKIANDFELSVYPFFNEIKKITKDKLTNLYLKIVEDNLADVFHDKLGVKFEVANSLTPNENVVLNLVRQGRQSKEIAEILNLSYATVSFHRHNIRRKLGIHNEKISLFRCIQDLIKDN